MEECIRKDSWGQPLLWPFTLTPGCYLDSCGSGHLGTARSQSQACQAGHCTSLSRVHPVACSPRASGKTVKALRLARQRARPCAVLLGDLRFRPALAGPPFCHLAISRLDPVTG